MNANTPPDNLGSQLYHANALNVDMAPSVAIATQYLSMAHSSGLMYHNAVQMQSQNWVVNQVSTVQGIVQVYSSNHGMDVNSIIKLLNQD